MRSFVLSRALALAAPAAALLVVLTASSALAQAPVWRQGHVTLADGRKIEGRILDRGDKVIVERGSVKLEFKPHEVKITYTESAPDAGAGGRRFVELELKDGSVVRGEIVDEKGGEVTIRPRLRGRDLPSVVVKQSDIAKTTNLPDLGPADGSGDESSDRYVDWDGRYLYEKISPEWQIKKSTSPEVRVRASLGDKDAFLNIAVKPLANLAAGSPWLDPTTDNARKVQLEVEAEVRGEFERPGSMSVSIGTLFGAPVYEFRFEANFPGEQTVYQFVEQRFVRDGLQYCLRAGAEKKDLFKTVEPQLRDAFTGFSFLGAQSMDASSYNDLVRGFGVDRPSDKWTIDARPFDEKEPVVMKNEDGRAEVNVRTVEASGKSASAYLDDFLKSLEADRKKAGFTLLEKKSDRRGGLSVETYHCEYYEPGSSRKRDFQGVVAAVERGIVHVEGRSPLSDVDSKQIQAEVVRTLEGLRFFDLRASRKRLTESSQAVVELAKGIDALKKRNPSDAAACFSEAIKLYEDYARAYFLRATANLEQKKYREYREDIEKALSLDPRPELEQRAVALYRQEVDLRVRDKQYAEAVRAWRDVIRADPKNEKLRNDFLRFYRDWWGELKRNAPGLKVKDALDEIESAKWSDRAFDELLSTFYVEAADTILRADKKQWSRAKQLASRALSLDRDNTKAKDMIKSCDDTRKSLEPRKK